MKVRGNVLFALLLLAVSCAGLALSCAGPELGTYPVPVPDGDEVLAASGDSVRVSFRIPACSGIPDTRTSASAGVAVPDTRTSFPDGGDEVTGLLLALYRNGRFDSSFCFDAGTGTDVVESRSSGTWNDAGTGFDVALLRGASYNLYALANAGQISFPEDESALDTLSIPANLTSAIPVSWKREAFVPKDGETVDIFLDRLVAELRLRVSPSLLPGLQLTSVRLCNTAAKLRPFATGGSRILCAEEAVAGDYASQEDLDLLNAGSEMTLYVPENRQGTLLPDNDDPMDKIPDNLDHPEHCTYIELGCVFTDESALEGNAVYRIYPGLDNCTNFDIVRNCRQSIRLCLTPEGLDEISWRVDADVDFRDGLAQAYVTEGLHALDNLYVGEVVKLGLDVDPVLEQWLGADLLDCKLELYGRDGQPSGAVVPGSPYLDGQILCFDMKAVSPCVSGGCQLRLSSGGRSTLVKGELAVNRPFLKAEIAGEMLIPVVNGSPLEFDVYMTDAEGRLLNGQDAYGYDFSLFGDMELDCQLNPALKSGDSLADRLVCDCHELFWEKADWSPGSPLGRVRTSLSNDGRRASLNRDLSRLYAKDYILDEEIWNYALSCNNAVPLDVPVTFDILPVKYWYYGDLTSYGELEVRGYGQLENDAYIAVSNPSRISLKAGVWTLGYGTFIADRLSGCSKLDFITSDGACEDLICASLADFVISPEDSSSFYLSVIDGTPVDCYPLVVNSGSEFTSISGWNRIFGDSRGTYKSGQADVELSTFGDFRLSCHGNDIYEATEDPASQVAVSDRGFVGLSTWVPPDVCLEARENRTSILGDYRISWPRRVMELAPAEISVYWSEGEGLVLEMSSNAPDCSFSVSMDVSYRASCQWQQNSGDSKKSMEFSEEASYADSQTFSGSSLRKVILPKSTVESRFSSMNLNYWHECSTNAINVAGNRFARLAVPSSIGVAVTLVPQQKKWSPVTLTVEESSSSTVTGKTIYASTKRGTYPVNGSSANPDGSSRGTHDSASSVAARYGDYVALDSPDFNVTVSAAGTKSLYVKSGTD
ncbi:MAG: DUF4906 domain-containing protein [Bacteroidales bacterium]|nr:DUF4906 domain-containing protein [Bacteroidales bacterium]